MAIQWRAEEQYEDMLGSVALDDADFERWERLLGLGGWIPLGLQVNCGHPPLGERRNADRSYTYLRVWALERDRLREGYSLPDLLGQERPVTVTEFLFDTAEIEYPEPSNAIAVLLRGSKRLDIVLWMQQVREANLNREDFAVAGEITMVWQDGAWTARVER